MQIENLGVVFYMTDDRRAYATHLKPSRPLPNLGPQGMNKCRFMEFNVGVPRSGPGALFEVP